jgi:hypothetical protein
VIAAPLFVKWSRSLVIRSIGERVFPVPVAGQQREESAQQRIAHDEHSSAHHGQSNAHREQAISEITTEITFKDDDDELYKESKKDFFIKEFIEIAKEEDLPEQEIKQIILELGKENQFTIEELNNAIKQTLNLWEKEPINDIGKLFTSNLKKEKRRTAWKERRNFKKTNQRQYHQPNGVQTFIDSTGNEFEFSFYNWLED